MSPLGKRRKEKFLESCEVCLPPHPRSAQGSTPGVAGHRCPGPFLRLPPIHSLTVILTLALLTSLDLCFLLAEWGWWRGEGDVKWDVKRSQNGAWGRGRTSSVSLLLFRIYEGHFTVVTVRQRSAYLRESRWETLHLRGMVLVLYK